MIKLNNVKILNYRSCLSTNLTLKNNLTALIGANGAGKSNILSSLLLFQKKRRSRFNYRIEKDLISKTRLIFDYSFREKKYKVKADILYDTDDKNTDNVVQYELSIKKDKKGEKYRSVKSSLLDLLRESYYYTLSEGKVGTVIAKNI